MTTTAAVSTSAKLYERALAVLPGGVSRNAVLRAPHPLYVSTASGCRITDVEGVARLDCSNNMCALIHGHAHPEINRAVAEQLASGTAYMMGTEREISYAEQLCARSPAFEKIRFVNSGTEAIMVALKCARAFTGRSKIAKVEGAYHGGYDYVEVSQTPAPSQWGDADKPANVPLVDGTPQTVLDEVVVLPFNDAENALALLDQHAGEIACVLLDLMPHRAGLRPADESYIEAIAQWARRTGALVVVDEVITFRTEVGGLQARYDFTPDLTALGKAIGGGFPIGAVVGRSEVMDLMNPRGERFAFPLSGTFNANPVSLTAGAVAMDLFDDAAVQRLNALGDRAREGVARAIESTGAPASVTGAGSLFRLHMKPAPPRNYREAYPTPDEAARLKRFLDHMLEAGYLMIGTGAAALSTPMGEADIDALVAAIADGLVKSSAAG